MRSPIDGKDSQLTWVLLTEAADFPGLHQIPSGRFQFIEFVGITEDEAEYARANGNNELLSRLTAHKASPITDPARKTLLAG